MSVKSRFYAFTAFVGDIAVMYASLWLALALRYRELPRTDVWEQHTTPFSLIFLVWAIVFYIGELYDPKQMHKNFSILQSIVRHQTINGALSILFFYIFPMFSIAPKTNLLITIGISTVLLYAWRVGIKLIAGRNWLLERLAFIGANDESKELIMLLQNNPQLGYTVTTLSHAEKIETAIQQKNIDSLVASLADAQQNSKLFQHIFHGLKFYDMARFYERIMGKIPLSMVQQAWFLENISVQIKRPYDVLKRFIDICIAIIGLVISLILTPFIALAITLTSKGPVFYTQKRISQHNRLVTLMKFRTMKTDAEKNGAQFADENDPRITPVGRWLRKTRLDELPQLWSVLKGDLSLVGPRPERPEWVSQFEKQIPYYSIRHLVKPGLTGWAQINYEYAASLQETYKKLQYDIYYIKNRSLLLDIGIILKTIKIILVRAGR